MGRVLNLFDRLSNALTGSGTARDPRLHNAYQSRIPSQAEIAAAYSGSGLMKRIIRLPAEEMVREWRTWEGGDEDQLAAIHDAEKRFALPQKVMQAEILRGLGGGAFIMGLPGDPRQPPPEGAPLAFLHVVSRWHLSFAQLNQDATSEGYGEPLMWQLSSAGGVTEIHPSRVIPFRGDRSATMLLHFSTGLDQYWGESRVQQVLDAVQDSDLARQSFAALIHKARLLRIGIPRLAEIVMTEQGEQAIMSRLSTMAAAESIHNATIFDAGDGDGKAGETVTDAEYSFAGVKDVLDSYGQWVAAISGIPATLLLGRAPEGLNSSGDSQQKDWHKRVRSMQTLDLAPCLDRLDPHLIAAAGQPIGDMSYTFDPLDTPGEKERADIFKVEMEAIEKLQMTGAVPERAFAEGVQSLMIERGYLPSLEAALNKMPDDERFGVQLEEDPDDMTEGGDPSLAGEGGDGEPASARRATNDGGAVLTAEVMREGDRVSFESDWQTEKGPSSGKVVSISGKTVTIAHSDDPGETFDADQLSVRWIGRADDGTLIWSLDRAKGLPESA